MKTPRRAFDAYVRGHRDLPDGTPIRIVTTSEHWVEGWAEHRNAVGNWERAAFRLPWDHISLTLRKASE